MKKLLFSALLVLAAAFAARAQFTYGLQFGLYTDNVSTSNSVTSATESGRSAFNYTVKPMVGYYFLPGLVAGVKFAYTNCSSTEGDTFLSATSIKSTAMNLLMGNGLGGDYRSWKVSPYLRFRTFSLLQDKLGVWVELDGYYGIHIPRADGVLDRDAQKTIYGIEIHPLVSYDVTDRYMIYTSLDYPSFNWDVSVRRSANKDGSVDTKRTNTYLVQANPLVAAARAVINVGVMRKF